jgi:hypothetical protein
MARFMREAFLHWAFDGQPKFALVEVDGGLVAWPWRELCRRLRDNDDVIPDDLCDWLGMAAGSRYGAAARRLLRDATDVAPSRRRSVDSEGWVCRWTGAGWLRLYRPVEEAVEDVDHA